MEDKTIFTGEGKGVQLEQVEFINDCIKEVCLKGDSLPKYKRIIAKTYPNEVDLYNKLEKLADAISQQVMMGKFSQTSIYNIKYLARDVYVSDDTIEEIISQLRNLESKGTYILTLTSVGPVQIQIVKYLKDYCGISFKEAKDLVDNVPSVISSDLSLEQAEKLKSFIELEGGSVNIESTNNDSVDEKESDEISVNTSSKDDENNTSNDTSNSHAFVVKVIKQGSNFNGDKYSNRTQLRFIAPNAHALPSREDLRKTIEKCIPVEYIKNNDQFEAYCPYRLFGWEEYRDIVRYPIYEIFDEISGSKKNDAYGIDVYYLSGMDKSNRTTKEKVVFWSIAVLLLIISLLFLNILGPILVIGIWYWHCKKISKRNTNELEEICGKIVQTIKRYDNNY